MIVISAFTLKVALSAGAVSDTVGALLAGLTIIVICEEDVIPFVLSIAFASRLWVPAGTFVQVKLKGADVSSPSFVLPL